MKQELYDLGEEVHDKKKIKSLRDVVVARFDEFLKTAIVPALDKALRTALESVFHFPPVVAVSQHVLAYFEVLLEGEVFLIDVGTQVVEIAFSDLFGSKF